MSVYKEHLKLQSHGGTPSYINVTPQVRAAIENSGIKEGICVVISPHTTCGVFFEEFVHDITPEGDEFLQADLNDVLKDDPRSYGRKPVPLPRPRAFQDSADMAECGGLSAG